MTNRDAGTGIAFLRRHMAHVGDECVLWPYCRNIEGGGYGIVYVAGSRCQPAHRVMCEMTRGPRPSRKHRAFQTCGAKACINPGHIIWKTLSAIRRDWYKQHGRRKLGPDGQPHRLTLEQAGQIRAIGSDLTQRQLGRQYGVSQRTIGRVINGETWATGKLNLWGGAWARANRPRGFVLSKHRLVAPRFYVPASIGFEYSNGAARAVAITQPVDAGRIGLVASIDRLHPLVKQMLIDVMDGASIEEAADDAGLGDRLPALLPRLREFLRQHVMGI